MNTVKKLLFMLMLTAGCANLHGVEIVYYNGTQRSVLKFDDSYIGNRTWLEVLREQFGDNQTFTIIVNGATQNLNQTITEEDISKLLTITRLLILIKPSTPLVADTAAAAAADTAAAAAAQPETITTAAADTAAAAAAQPETITTAAADTAEVASRPQNPEQATAHNQQAQADTERLLNAAIQAHFEHIKKTNNTEITPEVRAKINAVLETCKKSHKQAMEEFILNSAMERLGKERRRIVNEMAGNVIPYLLKSAANTVKTYAPSAFAATVLAVVAYRYNFASNFFGFIKNLVTKRATKLLARN
jgi:hypothetical protein